MAPMSHTPAAPESHTGLSKHRLEALTDGIFAVAMTLLVIELKLPEHATVRDASDLANGVVRLIPTFIAWIISFFVLAIFWFSHHRLFHYVRIVDGRLLWLNILYLGFVSLMPFSSALAGQYPRMLFSQWFYSSNMFYRGARFRSSGLVVVALVAVGITMFVPASGNAAFMLMIPISMLSRRVEQRAERLA
jgi:uncharacterized membrane protein